MVSYMKKKIAVFTTGWCGEILAQFLTGLRNALKFEQIDLFLFLCYPTYIDTPAVKRGELNIFSLPNLNDFDGVVIFASGLDFNNIIDNIIERSKQAGAILAADGVICNESPDDTANEACKALGAALSS